MRPVAVIDPAVRVPELDCFNRMSRRSRLPLTHHLPALFGLDSLRRAEADLRGIERSIGRTLPRITVPDFDYKARPHVRLEIPMAQRIAAIRKRKADDRARAKANADRRGGAHSADKPQAPARTGPQQRPSGPKPRGPGRSSRKRRPSRHRF